MNFFRELRRRKVFRVGAAYLVAAWLAVQVASIALPAFDAPSWAMRVFILIAALGFPMALLLSWALELTPEGLRFTHRGTGRTRMLVIAGALFGLSFAWYFYGQPALRQQLAASERSIAVLPFVNMSGDKANEYFSDGLSETTLDMLAQIKDLRVIARTSSFAFKGKPADVREIGRALDAAHLLEGSVQQSGDMLRITVQLVRSSDGTHLWSRKYDRPLKDLFRVQDEIASEVVAALQLKLPRGNEPLSHDGTRNLAAYDEYLKGVALLRERKVAAMHQALAHFQRALKLDPGYARAHAMAANAYILLETYQGVDDRQQAAWAAHTAQALALDPDLGEAHIAQATLYLEAGDIPNADRSFRRGLELAPSYATGWQWYAENLHTVQGRLDEGVRAYEKALALDPLSPIIRQQYALVLADVGRMEEAEQRIDALLREKPGFAVAYTVKSRLREERGDLVGALRALNEHQRLDPGALGRLDNRCQMLIALNAMDDARRCVDRLRRDHPGLKDLPGLEARLLMAAGRLREARAAITDADDWNAILLDLSLGKHGEARARLERLVPEMFETPPRFTQFPEDPYIVGWALMQTGESERGRAMLREGIARHRGKPHLGVDYGVRWSLVAMHTLLGDIPQACAALREAVQAGVFRDIHHIDHSSALAPLRADPCYARELDLARARAKAEVEKARAAGLLDQAADL